MSISLKTEFKTYRDATSQPNEFRNGTLVTERAKLPAAMQSANRVVAFVKDGSTSYYTATDRDAQGMVTFALYDEKYTLIAQGRQYGEDEGGVLNWE